MAPPAEYSPESTGSVSGPGTKAKRRRLTFACNYCRARKTRCDEGQPSCHACIVAGVPCVTEDRRKPGRHVERREAGRRTPILANARNNGSIGPNTRFGLLTGHPRSPRHGHGVTQRHTSSEPTIVSASATEIADAAESTTSWGHTLPDMNRDQVKFTGSLPMWREVTGTTSLEILTDWLDLALYRLGQPQRMAPLHLKANAEPISFPLIATLHNPPGLVACTQMATDYLETVNSVFPILESDQVRSDVETLCLSESSQSLDTCTLLRSYFLLAAGAANADSEWSRAFFKDCMALGRSCLGHLVANMSLEAIQTLFLFSICLKYNNEASAASAILGICVSTAMALGLNRSALASPRKAQGKDSQSRRRVWLAIYCYEKLHSFELGRVSCINDYDYGQPESHDILSQRPQDDNLTIILGLSKTLSEVGRQCARARLYEDPAAKGGLEAVIAEKVKTTGEMCLMLLKWADDLPQEYR